MRRRPTCRAWARAPKPYAKIVLGLYEPVRRCDGE